MKTEQKTKPAAINSHELHALVNNIRAQYGLPPLIHIRDARIKHINDVCHRNGKNKLYRRASVIERAHADAKRLSQNTHTMKKEKHITSTHTLTMTGSNFAKLEQLCTKAGIDIASLALCTNQALELPDTTHFTKEAADLYDRLQQHATLLDACATLTIAQRNDIHAELLALASCLDTLDQALLAATSYRDNVKKWLQIAPADPSEI